MPTSIQLPCTLTHPFRLGTLSHWAMHALARGQSEMAMEDSTLTAACRGHLTLHAAASAGKSWMRCSLLGSGLAPLIS